MKVKKVVEDWEIWDEEKKVAKSEEIGISEIPQIDSCL